jgi:hypothetical protein
MQDRREGGIEGSRAVSREKWILLVSLSVLIAGCVGYFSLPRGLLIFYLFAHLGALGLLGLIGGAVGILARRKRRGYWTAFSLGSLLPIASGAIAVTMTGDQVSCGGSVSLMVSALVVVFYLLAKKRTLQQAGYAG